MSAISSDFWHCQVLDGSRSHRKIDVECSTRHGENPKRIEANPVAAVGELEVPGNIDHFVLVFPSHEVEAGEVVEMLLHKSVEQDRPGRFVGEIIQELSHLPGAVTQWDDVHEYIRLNYGKNMN